MTPATRWALTLGALLGEPWPALPALPGRICTARDEPLPREYLAGIEGTQELALCLGISRQCASLRLQAYRRTGNTAALLGRDTFSPTAAATAAASL